MIFWDTTWKKETITSNILINRQDEYKFIIFVNKITLDLSQKDKKQLQIKLITFGNFSLSYFVHENIYIP